MKADPSKSTDSVLYQGRYLRFLQDNDWEYVERIKAMGIVAILATTDTGKILLVEQYRTPLRAHTIEIPSGVAGDLHGNERETLSEAANRELLEETGYLAETIEYLTEGPVSAGLSTEIVTFFRAHGLTKSADGAAPISEKIVVHEVDRKNLTAWLNEKHAEGKLIDYRIYAALYLGT
ncbi:ADP-ribose pyrophosphatase [Verrucomicrobium sp. GAS474]|uniref:NUDIX hydrolase n=1 Tax=Verrucomicrobium sp. GAS474 TaxID=1882831 RepID=UPI00087A94DB|nr:NUDIX hydrolase [Verrucomicrobium sp. GAS474]SDU18970.1 ADP-ribose pyrophosphatase [Verrucomicrobium sp. GAS474]